MWPSKFIIILLALCLFSCADNRRAAYAIRDFRKELQPHLIEMIERGIVLYRDSVLQYMATDEELVCLGKSEHPILRAAAYREMLKRKSFDHFDVVMGHLDDTALVFTDAGEFGIWDRTVSDDMLQEAGWKTEAEKNATIEQVITRHNYLQSAYIILDKQGPLDKYYVFIKDMAKRPRRLDPDNGYELEFGTIEYALYGLAKYQKKEDVLLIKEKLMDHVWKLSDVSFRLMKEYPDTSYLDVLQLYHSKQFYKFSGNRPHGFTGMPADRAAPEDFIGALAVQQNERSAKLLETMLAVLPKATCFPDKENIIHEVMIAIWEHPCPSYVRLRERIKHKAQELVESRISLQIDRQEEPVDTTKENYRW